MLSIVSFESEMQCNATSQSKEMFAFFRTFHVVQIMQFSGGFNIFFSMKFVVRCARIVALCAFESG